MKVLDLDLDFFLSDCCPPAALGERPQAHWATPWNAPQVRDFLETHCGLSRERKVCGRVFETHDRAIDFWAAHISDGTLSTPFEVIHVDAHADLGIGRPGPDFVLKAVLTKAPEARATIDAYRAGKKLDEANYLLFALSFRWINRLVLVRNPRSRPDIPQVLREGADALRLTSDIARLMQGKNGEEPRIAFEAYDDFSAFEEGGYDYVTLAHSPRYAPQTIDDLMDVVREYIAEV